MEWIETTGRSVEEAKDRALDQLGVDESEAEFEILAEAELGLFGRLRKEARVRARIRPTVPRPKEDRRDRRRRSSSGASRSTSTDQVAGSAKDDAGSASSEHAESNGGRTQSRNRLSERRRRGSSDRIASAADRAEAAGDQSGMDSESSDSVASPRRTPASRSRSSRSTSVESAGGVDTAARTEPHPKGSQVEVAMQQQAELASDFLRQLVTEMGLEASLAIKQPDDETVEIELTGRDLGILIGPKGQTLSAIQNLARTLVFNETGATNGHINVDVGGYRQKRSDALARFATQVASQVKQSGKRTALEPMTAVDRKVVHDTISTIEGVSTISEGEEPRRRVVVLPG